MKIVTKRLIILALKPEEIISYADNLVELGHRLGFLADANPEEWFADIIRKQAILAINDPEHALWHTFWMMIRKDDHQMIGSIDFKHVPTEDGVVEIGYGIDQRYENQGFMTETVQAFAKHAIRKLGVKQVIAETEITNVASMRVLEKSDFIRIREDKSSVWWEYRPSKTTHST